MRLATVLTPITDQYLQTAAQCGVSDIVHRYPGPNPRTLAESQQRIASFGLRLGVVEGYLPIEAIKIGRDDGTELTMLKELIRQMGDLGIPLLCYNFMAGTDWVRTRADARERGGALVTEFRLSDAEHAVSLNQGASLGTTAVPHDLTADQLWCNLDQMLQKLLPIAERFGVTLAMHPDDPPLPNVCGQPRIQHSVEAFERLMRMAPSPHNAICFCQGTFAAMEIDVPAAIRRLGKHIRYVHFRDVRGNRAAFSETFHDNGPTDMVAAMHAYQEIGFDGPMCPDHVPQLVGEEAGEPGYTMLGRLFAFGYMRALIQATTHRQESSTPRAVSGT